MLQYVKPLFTACIVTFAFLTAQAVPTNLSFQSKIYKPDGTALEAASVNFRFTTVDPTGTCILYVEDFTGTSMSGSAGLAILNLGTGTKVYPTGAYTFTNVFNNLSTSFNCRGGGTYSPNVSGVENRKIIAQFFDGSGSGWQTLPAIDINSVPFANYTGDSAKLAGYTASDFLRFATLPVCTGSDVLTATNPGTGTNLSCVPGTAGTVSSVTSANSYLSIATGTTTPDLTVNVGTAAGTVAAGNDGRFTDARTPTGTAGGDLAGTYPNPILANIVASATNTKITYDAKGRVTAGASLIAADIPNLDAAKITTGTLPATIGGTGQSTYAVGDLLYASSASALSRLPASTTGLILTSNGVGTAPTWQATQATQVPENALVTYKVRVATTANITLSAPQTVDGVILVAGDRVLVKNQGTVSQNGIYVVAAGAWVRAADMSTWLSTVGYTAQVSEGSAWAGMTYVSATNVAGTVGTTPIDWAAAGATSTLDNTANGKLALYSNTTGNQNTANGKLALYYNTTGNQNTANGESALYNNTTSFGNTASGMRALYTNTTGGQNTASGMQALYFNTWGSENTANGWQAMYSNAAGSGNTANGWRALYTNTGNQNTANGGSALYDNTTGYYNTANGVNALSSNRAKSESTAIGFNAMLYADNTTAAAISYNTALGAYSLRGSVTAASNTGLRNTALGHSSLLGMTSGSGNIGVGYNSGSAITTGSNNVVIGSNTGAAFATGSNNISISDGAGTERIRVLANGNVGIGQAAPQAALDVVSVGTSSAIIIPRDTTANRPVTLVNGMIRYNTTTALFEFYQNGVWVNYTTVSDGRLKTNVISVNHGLNIVNQLNPVFFDWDQNNPRAQGFGSQHQVGFIAQEVEMVLPEVVNKGEDSYRSVEYGKIVSVVVAAVKELYAIVMGHDKKIQTLNRDIASVNAKLETDNAAKDEKINALEQQNAAIKAYLCAKDPNASICN